jgi:hypothetical protein
MNCFHDEDKSEQELCGDEVLLVHHRSFDENFANKKNNKQPIEYSRMSISNNA